MSEEKTGQHAVTLTWNRGEQPFDYKTFDRTHFIDYDHGVRVLASSTKKFYGDDRLLNPDVALVGALSSCFMLTFLAIAALKKCVVNEYKDRATGEMGQNEEGKTWVSRIELSPVVVFEKDSKPTEELFQEMIAKAHTGCFIANSVKSSVEIQPTALSF